MKSLPPCGARVEVHESETFVGLDLQDVRVSGNKKVGWVFTYQGPDAFVVLSRVSADMSHPHVRATEVEPLIERMFVADFEAVDVAVDASEWFKVAQLVRHF